MEPVFVNHGRLRARLARDLSDLYAAEVPAYQTLVDVCLDVNRAVLTQRGEAAERLGSLARVTEERHGAVRVGTPAELGQLRRIFAAAGMVPVGFYDLRDSAVDAIPVVSTAFRPIDEDELASNPFRVFTSMLTPGDRRFFSPELEQRLRNFLARRQLFPARLLTLADRSIEYGGLDASDADEFLTLVRGALALSHEPLDKGWYDQLAAISGVAADIGGTAHTHINHLTPRVLDIDALYAAMTARKINMIDRIQGPPRWSGPEILLRQTSFRALDEPRRFRLADGTETLGSVRVRFGEVESRGIALTHSGRDLYHSAVAKTDARFHQEGGDHAVIAREMWDATFPATDEQLASSDLGFFRYMPATPSRRPAEEPESLDDLLEQGLVELQPIVYEDFLPRSAAGIFASNLESATHVNSAQEGQLLDQDWLSSVIEADIVDPIDQYDAQRNASIVACAGTLGIDPAIFMKSRSGSRTTAEPPKKGRGK